MYPVFVDDAEMSKGRTAPMPELATRFEVKIERPVDFMGQPSYWVTTKNGEFPPFLYVIGEMPVFDLHLTPEGVSYHRAGLTPDSEFAIEIAELEGRSW